MKIAIGNDHTAVDLKNTISDYLKELGYEVINLGTDSRKRKRKKEPGYRLSLKSVIFHCNHPLFIRIAGMIGKSSGKS